jgi:hypothetical protein
MVFLVLIAACGDNENPTAPDDTTAPAAITTLATGTVTAHTVILTWTAVGDDGATGTAKQYDIRYSTATITADNFASASAVSGEPTPTAAGTAQTMTVTGLTAATPYYFAMKTRDEASNWSDISNVAPATTAESGDESAPVAVTDLDGAATSTSSVLLTWTAPGDDESTGTAAEYDIRYATGGLTNASWGSATPVSGEPAPAVAGTAQQMTVAGLEADEDYYFAMKTRDEAGNESAISNIEMVSTPASQTLPPGLLTPDFPDSVCISSTDEYALYAKLSVQSQLFVVNAYAAVANAFFAPLQGADWQHPGDCWTYDYTYGGCTAHYEVCQTGSEYTYTMTVDGSCYGDTYDNWVQYRANVDTDARTGTFRVYELNTTNIEAAWIWTWAADENSGTYTFYQGDPATTPIDATIEWSRSANHNVFDVTYLVPEQSKIETHFVKEPCSGWQHTYEWNSTGAAWWQEYDIVWNPDGTGYWDTYDQEGALQEHHTW